MEPKDPALVLQLGTGLVCGVGGIGVHAEVKAWGFRVEESKLWNPRVCGLMFRDGDLGPCG